MCFTRSANWSTNQINANTKAIRAIANARLTQNMTRPKHRGTTSTVPAVASVPDRDRSLAGPMLPLLRHHLGKPMAAVQHRHEGNPMRHRTVIGTLLTAWPTDGGPRRRWLKQILHDWDDEHAEKILATCRRSMPANSRLLVLEMMIEPNVAFPRRLDLMMMGWTGGRERTQGQFERLFADTGFSLVATRRTIMPICVLEAQPDPTG
jgi:hypothetical protein